MNSRIVTFSALTIAIILATPLTLAQTAAIENTALDSAAPLRANPGEAAADPATFVTLPPQPRSVTKTWHPFSALGFATRVGIAGTGFDIATPLATRFNLRAGGDFFTYTDTFQEQRANIGINLHLRTGHAALDWFPFNGRFRLSPQLVFANNNRILATALIPSGSTITLNGQDYISSATDPLHGTGRIDFRKVSPGFSLGFGNIVPRTRSHFTIPIELGFYYVGQPTLQVAFSGTACDPNYPPSEGCESVDDDPGFQQNLTAFRARNNHNLSYASFFPIFSLGFAYRFW
jgi:hypothetical protein